MKKKISPSVVKGLLTPPSSKSYMQRAVAIAALIDGSSTIYNPSYSDDGQAALSIAQKMGAQVTHSPDKVEIVGAKELRSNIWDCGESGLSTRMFSALAGLQKEPITITGHGSILNRPMKAVDDVLLSAGLSIESNRGFLPLRISGGPLRGGTYKVNAPDSSQALTGLIIALASLSEDVVLEVEELVSRPYIDITLDLLRHFGVEVNNVGYKKFLIPGSQNLHPRKYTVEADWSGASFLCVAAAIGGEVKLQNLSPTSHQGDSAILEAITQVGANTSINNDGIGIKKNELRPFIFDASECPDLFPPLVALAVNCRGTSHISGVHRLLDKESNRFQTLQEEFGKLGIQIGLDDDTMTVVGGTCKGSLVSGRGDHRIAMALSIAALNSEGYVLLDDWTCVSKSYPAFFDDFKSIGGKVATVE